MAALETREYSVTNSAATSVSVLYRGGRITSGTTILDQDTGTVAVFDLGALAVGDAVYVNGDGAKELGVDSISGVNVTLSNASGITIGMSAGDNLLIASRAPEIFQDPLLSESFGTGVNSVALDGSGHGLFYTREPNVDLTWTGGSISGVAVTPWVNGVPLSWINASGFPSIQAAIDSLPSQGGTIFIPAGVHTLTETLYTPCDRPCHLIGDGGPHPAGLGTVLRWTTMVGMIRLRGDGSSIQRMTLDNTYSGSSTPSAEDQGCGILVGRRDVTDAHPVPLATATTEYLAANHAPLQGILIEDVIIHSAPGWGLYIPGKGVTSDGTTAEPHSVDSNTTGEGGTLSFWVDCKRVRITGSRKYGDCFTGGGCTTLFFENCAFLGVGAGQVDASGYYVYVSGSVQTVFTHCTIEGYSPTSKEWVKLSNAISAIIESCWFEEDSHGATTSYTPTAFVYVANGCSGGAIRNCHFVRGGVNNGLLKCIKLASSGVRGLLISEPFAISNTATRSTTSPFPYLDTGGHVDLGGNDNADITIVGTGVVSDTTGLVPLQYTSMPATSNIIGRVLNKLPGVTDDVVVMASSDSKALAQVNGNLVLNWDLPLDSTAIAAAMYYWGGSQEGWRLTNNLPTLTTTQRDNGNHAWVQGDMIYNSCTTKLEIRVGTTWKTVTLT